MGQNSINHVRGISFLSVACLLISGPTFANHSSFGTYLLITLIWALFNPFANPLPLLCLFLQPFNKLLVFLLFLWSDPSSVKREGVCRAPSKHQIQLVCFLRWPPHIYGFFFIPWERLSQGSPFLFGLSRFRGAHKETTSSIKVWPVRRVNCGVREQGLSLPTLPSSPILQEWRHPLT